MKEVWKDIKGYEGDYQVSNKGVVRSRLKPTTQGAIRSNDWHIIEESLLNDDAPRVMLVNGKEKKYRYVGQLVLETFVGPKPSENHQALRINSKLQDVELNNLKWGTRKELTRLSRENDTMARGVLHPKHKLSSEDVIEIKDELVNGFLTITEIAEIYGVTNSTISQIKRNIRWKHIPWPEGEINEVITKNCKYCGDAFDAKRFSVPQKFCSPKHRKDYDYYVRQNHKG